MNSRIKTPFADGKDTPIHVGDILKHYCYEDDPEMAWDYDIGVVLNQEQTHELFGENDDTQYWFRTTLHKDIRVYILDHEHYYLIIGNTTEPRVNVAVRLWLSLSNKQRENYYCGDGIIGFLKEFKITNSDDPLDDDEIQHALDKIYKLTLVE